MKSIFLIIFSMLICGTVFQAKATAIIQKESSELKNNVVFKDVNGGKKVEITFTIPVGCKPFVYRGKQKLEFKSHDNQISFSIDKKDLSKTAISLYKEVYKSDGGKSCNVVHHYNFKLHEFYSKK